MNLFLEKNLYFDYFRQLFLSGEIFSRGPVSSQFLIDYEEKNICKKSY